MKKLFGLLVLVAIACFYAHGRFVFSKAAIQQLAVEHDQLANSAQAENACERFTKDVVVEIEIHNAEGPQKIEGGYEEMCDLIRRNGVMFQNLPLRYSNEFSGFVVTRGAFPWLDADASFDTHARLDGLPGMSVMKIEGHEEISLVRSFDGVKIRKLVGTIRQFSE